FDRRVALRGDARGSGQRFWGPATRLLLRPLHLPRLQAQAVRELVRVAPARCGDPRDGTDPVGEGVGDDHRIDADVQRPPQRLQRTGQVPGDGRIRDGEPADLGPTAVVPADGGAV